MKPNETLADLLTFKATEVVKRLREWEREATELRARADELATKAVMTREFFRIQGVNLEADAEEGEAPFLPGIDGRVPMNGDLRGLSIAEASYRILKSIAPRSLNGRTLLTLLQNAGLPIGGEQPMATLSTSLRRDPRLEKANRNVWRLKEAAHVDGA
jgi:hypothetical protein